MGRLIDLLPHDGLSGAKATLRPLAADDAAWIVAAGDDPEIVFWNGLSSPCTLAQADQLVEVRQKGWDDDSRATFAILDGGGRPGGYVSLRVGWSRGIGELGYWLLATHRGLGLATDAVRLLRDWAFDVVGLTRLQAGIQPGNSASEAVVLRLGFTREGRLRDWDKLNGILHDEWMFSLLPSDPRL